MEKLSPAHLDYMAVGRLSEYTSTPKVSGQGYTGTVLQFMNKQGGKDLENAPHKVCA